MRRTVALLLGLAALAAAPGGQTSDGSVVRVAGREIWIAVSDPERVRTGARGRVWREELVGGERVVIDYATFVVGRVDEGLARATLDRALDEVTTGMAVRIDRLQRPPPEPAPSRPRDRVSFEAPRFVEIPAGSFEMGCVPLDNECDPDERPRRTVQIDRGFALAATETTNRQYLWCVQEGVCSEPLSSPHLLRDPARAAYPVLGVTRAQAEAYCRAVGGRLPSEAEWEYSARGGRTGALYPWGQAPPVCAFGAPNGARFDDQLGCDDLDVPVGSYPANGFGLFDMAGSAWEWVAASPGEAGGIVRGGAFSSSRRALRCSNRKEIPRGRSAGNIGFRCAR